MFNNNNKFNQQQQQQQEQPPPSTLLLDSNNLESFSKSLYGNLISAIKVSNTLPIEDDYAYYTTYPAFKDKMNQFGQRLLGLTQNFATNDNANRSPLFDTTDDVDQVSDQFGNVVDIVDGLIDRVDQVTNSLMNDNNNNNNSSNNTTNNKTNILATNTIVSSTKNMKTQNDLNMFYGHNIMRPQLKFEDPIDNSPFPFLPKIIDKPNSMVPLDTIFKKAQVDIQMGKIVRTKELEKIIFPHPYEYELTHFRYTDKQSQKCKEMIYSGLEQTPYTWVDTRDQLQLLCEKLKHVEEFAVDLEAHNYRSFLGFVCLMQISTRTEDYIIDTLALRSSMKMLNVVFTDPRIVKVLHGSEGDVKWLQRDFGIYIVNMFDTGQASRILEFPSASLAFLLRFYCGVDANKKFQLADWRIRPVPAEMAKYAREDTHYLLYIYDRMRNELVLRGKGAQTHLLEVLRRSRELCLLKYEKEGSEDPIEFCKKQGLAYGGVNLRVFKVLYMWRDRVAREEDESTRYVLPNAMIQSIVEKQPTSVNDLLSCCTTVPPLLKMHAHQLIQDILKAKIEETTFVNQQIQSHHHHQQHQHQQQSNHLYLNQQNISNGKPSTGVISNLQQQPIQPLVSISTSTTQLYTNQQHSQHSQSPVLSTHELYKTAGWLDYHSVAINEPPIPLQSLVTPTPRRTATVHVANQNMHSNVAFSQSIAFADSSDDSSIDDQETKKHKKMASSVKSSFETSTSITAPFVLQNLKSTELQQQQQSQSKQPNQQQQSPQQQSQQATTKLNDSKSIMMDDDDDDDDDIMITHSDQPNNDQQHQQQQQQGEGEGKSIDEEEIEAQLSDSGSEEEIPRSMEEIYQLSNLNRRRNKEKKKLKETSNTSITFDAGNTSTGGSGMTSSTNTPSSSTSNQTPSSSNQTSTNPTTSSSDQYNILTLSNGIENTNSITTSTSSLSNSQKKKSELLDADPITFMKGIGWIPDGGLMPSSMSIDQPITIQTPQPTQQPQQPHQQHQSSQPILSTRLNTNMGSSHHSQQQQQQQQQSNTNKSTNPNKNTNKKPFVPFDYSQQQLPQNMLPQSNVFNFNTGNTNKSKKPNSNTRGGGGVKSTVYQPKK